VLELVDTSAAAFGVEPRFPFFDKRLVEFCLALPADQKIDRGWTRVVLRRGLEHLLPRAIRWRGDKADLGPNFYRSLLRDERDTMEAVVDEEPGPVDPYVDDDRLESAYRRYASTGGGPAGMYVWKAVTLDRWLRRQYDP